MARLLFVLTHSTEAPGRAMDGLRTALAAQREGHEVGLWLMGEGVRLGVTSVAETLREPGPETAAEIIEALTEGGAVLHMERVAFELREFQPDAARNGATVVDAGRLAALVADGWSAVTL
ncbi:MAG: DsrE family protein [Planctomycetota bacterium]|nr:DsrE family protein [Planctomycetota bacterium]